MFRYSYRKDSNIIHKRKLYHYSNEGVASWYDFAIAIMELGKSDCKVNQYKQRLSYSCKKTSFFGLNKSKIKTDFNIEIPYWRDSLERCIRN